MAFKTDRQRKAVMASMKGKVSGRVHNVPTVRFCIDLVQAEFVNDETDDSNVWNWRSGQELTRWTDGSDWVIAKAAKYPEDFIRLRRAD